MISFSPLLIIFFFLKEPVLEASTPNRKYIFRCLVILLDNQNMLARAGA